MGSIARCRQRMTPARKPHSGRRLQARSLGPDCRNSSHQRPPPSEVAVAGRAPILAPGNKKLPGDTRPFWLEALRSQPPLSAGDALAKPTPYAAAAAI